jgi:hypothetical protein
MRSLSTKPLMGSVWSLTQRSPKVTIALQGKSVFLSRLANPSRQTTPNGNICSTSHGQSSHIVKLQNGACANFKAHLEDSRYHWELRIRRSELTSLRHASVFIIYVHGWWVSTILGMCMCLYGAKGPAIEFGRGSRVSYSPINRSTIGSAHSTFERNGTEGPMPFSIP